MSQTYRSLATRLIHSGEPEPRIAGAVNLPIFQSSTFEDEGHGEYDKVRYIRLNNTPNHEVLHRKLAAIEEAEAAAVTASGMAAISSTLLGLLSAGDHLLVQSTLYGGTHTFVREDLPRLGIEVTAVDGQDPAAWEAARRPDTKAIYVEALGNPLLEVPDLEGVVGFARQHHLISMIDATFATPINFQPCPFGFDLVLHSATKYLNGHSDIVAGVVAGRGQLLEKIAHHLIHFGGSLDPHAAFLLHRGLKTLGLRVAYQNQSALGLATALEAHPSVQRVHYAGLESSPSHGRARELFGGFGGMLSFEVAGGQPAALDVVRKLNLPVHAPSLGGTETLITLPSMTSHAGLDPEERRGLGISDGLLRVSVGIEDTEELIEDFHQALS